MNIILQIFMLQPFHYILFNFINFYGLFSQLITYCFIFKFLHRPNRKHFLILGMEPRIRESDQRLAGIFFKENYKELSYFLKVIYPLCIVVIELLYNVLELIPGLPSIQSSILLYFQNEILAKKIPESMHIFVRCT